MKIFDAGQEANGFIAIGQVATGVIAIGQLATGVIAVGQVARGGICVGQGAIGLVTVGMGSVGIFHSTGMVGLGGRNGLGLILPLVPKVEKSRVRPETVPFQAVQQQGAGWLEVAIGNDAYGVGLFQGGQRLPVKIDRRILGDARELAASPPEASFAYVRWLEGVFVCERIQYIPAATHRAQGFWGLAALRMAVLIALGIGFWPAAGNDVLHQIRLVGADPPAKPVPAAPAPAPRPPKSRGH